MSVNIPETMKAAQGKDYGDINEMLSVEQGVKVPRLADLPEKKRKNHMIIKTLAVSLAPGDCRVLSGKTRKFQGPPSFPYIPGGDCSGIVVELPKQQDAKDEVPLPFVVGDLVAVRFAEGPRGALGEYACVSTKVCDKVPDGITANEASALAGATPATLLAERVRPGDRVLILGAGGGEGSHLCQHVRRLGASYIVGVSMSPDRLLQEPMNCDRAIDYTKEDIFNMPEFQKDPFDTVFDLASGGWLRLRTCNYQKSPLIVKPFTQGGKYLTMCPDTPTFDAPNLFSILQLFLLTPLYRAAASRLWLRRSMPSYSYVMALPFSRGVVTRTLSLSQEKKLTAVIDGPFPFTTEGVRAAFNLQDSRHPKGKVVIEIAPGDQKS